MGRDPDRAVKIACEVLNDSPDDVDAMMLIAYLFGKAGRHGLSLALLARASQVAPHRHEIWAGMGVSWQRMGNELRSRQMFQEGAKRKPGAYLNEIATTYIEEGDWKRAEQLCRKVLAQHPDDHGAWTTLGYARLAQGDWREGWKGYAHSLMSEWRKEIILGDEPRWDGRKGANLFVYGEQGLGDEIMYASCVPDAARDAASVVLECDPRLEGLFRRSFPNVSVYGTRLKQGVDWLHRHQIDARVGVAGLPEYYRPEPAACPGTPYLVADPERRMQWRVLLDSLGPRPKIGICWSGGKRWTKGAARTVGLEALRPLIESVDADWVSLQYKDPTDEIQASGLPVHHWRRAVESNDYDDTAGLVAELDAVIGIHTTVHHLAGALGVPGLILVPSRPSHMYALPVMPWYGSARLFRQRDKEPWVATIKRLTNDPESMDWLRSPRSGGVSRLHAVDNRAIQCSGCAAPADAGIAALVS
jgi:hypothetical protein